MSYILISFPCKSIKKYFWTNPNVILLDEEGFLKYSLKNKTREYLVNNNNFSDVSKIRQLLNWWTPVLERWQGTSILNEQKRIRYLFLINEILSILKEYNIKNVIQITAVPHHIDNLLVSIACNIELINEFTLYPNVFDGRLVPLIQKGSIFDRKVFKYKKSKINYDIIIDDFLNNYKKGNPPSINSKPNFFKTSFELTALMIYVKGVKSLFKPITNQCLELNNFKTNEDDFSFKDRLILVREQKRFLKLYKRISIENTIFKNIIKSKKIFIITAHYQPEATSFPEGGDFYNHFDIAMKIRSLGYKDVIYYKEHPASKFYTDFPSIFLTKVSLYKNITYLNALEALNCQFINQDFDLNINTEYSENFIPISIGGTIAIERALNGYKTILFGEPYFKDMPGVIHVKDINSKDDLINIDTRFSAVIKEKSRIYLKNLLDNNTIKNSTGIGTGKKDTDIDLKEMDSLINYILHH
jgi:hypothetical protein